MVSRLPFLSWLDESLGEEGGRTGMVASQALNSELMNTVVSVGAMRDTSWNGSWEPDGAGLHSPLFIL